MYNYIFLDSFIKQTVCILLVTVLKLIRGDRIDENHEFCFPAT